ncbi:MAG: amidohydrolase family protein [Bacteroidota bacterium]
MKKTKCYLPLIAILSAVLVQGQMPKAEDGIFALTNAKIETITQGTIENGIVVLKDGRIESVGTDVSIPSDAKTINCNGLTIYPGMIDGGTQIGLVEVGSDPRTRDNNEIGDIIPHVHALTAVNPSSVVLPVTRVNGVTTALTAPSGGLFPGTAALINLHGYTPDQMYAGFKAVVLNFPMSGRRGRYDRRSDEDIKKAAEKGLKKLNEVWSGAIQYFKIDSATNGGEQDYYPEMEALLPVLKREMKLLINVNIAGDIKAALKWIENKNIDVIFTGVREGWRAAKELAEAKIPVITGPVLTNPSRAYDKYDRPYANAGLMQQAGVKVAIKTSEIENVRNLPYHAGFAATYGMGKEEALKAVTIVPAEIFGVEKELGSIEVGKKANVFVTDGDPFETKTQVKYVFIDGYKIPMESRHTQLYEEYLERTPGTEK